jgi:hypothetical protein
MNKSIMFDDTSNDESKTVSVKRKRKRKDIKVYSIKRPEIYSIQGNSGFKTPLKIVSGNPKLLEEYEIGRPVKLTNIPPTDYKLDIRKSVKKYGLPIVSSRPNVFQADIMDKRRKDDYVYLVAININNRYGYVIPLNVDEKEDEFFVTNSAKNKQAVVKAFSQIIKQIIDTDKALFGTFGGATFITDAERTFQSAFVGNFLKRNNIELVGKVDKAHTRLAIIDRFIRTLRDMAYVKYKVKHNIDPYQMRDILEEYNQSFHLGLSKIASVNVSPALVRTDRELEAMIVRRQLTKLHDRLMDSDIPIGSPVIVHFQALDINGLLPFKEKKRYTTLPGDWVVVGREGVKYIVSNESPTDIDDVPTNEVYTLTVPRWMIKVKL